MTPHEEIDAALDGKRLTPRPPPVCAGIDDFAFKVIASAPVGRDEY